METKRCKWCNEKNKIYIKYHDSEWGIKNEDDAYLFEMLILESFQAGLSWECILNKVLNYDDKKINELRRNKGIIRNSLKIKASINNAKIFKSIIDEYGNFITYLYKFAPSVPIYETNKSNSLLSDEISKDLKKRGMKFVGTTIIYSYLQAIGIINSHEKNCFMYKEEKHV